MNRKKYFKHFKVIRKGDGNPYWKGGLPLCIDCNKSVKVYTAKRCRSCASKYIHTGRKRQQWEKDKISESMKILLKDPTKNPSWKGGLSYERYPREFNRELKEEIKKRDNYVCKNCNMTEKEHIIVMGYGLACHHIDYDKKNNDINNLIALCNWCNIRANYNRDYWKNKFKLEVRIT